MSNIACEMLPGGGFIMRRAEECSEADRAKNFYCIHCRVRVYLHLPEAGRGISPYFSADSEPHKKECPNYREDLFRTVTHLDHTGSGVDLSELMKGFRQVDHRPRPEGGKGKSGGPISGIEKGPAEETDRPIRREARTPKTIIQLYGILKDPSVTEYAGHDAQELIVDKSTINYHRNHTLDHPAMVVCKRCTPPQKIKGRLADEGIYPRSLTFRAPYAAPQKQKDIYRNDRDPEAVLQMDWGEAPLLNDFFSDLGERLYGEEITKLRQKQAEYLALQNQINPHFLYNALEAIRTDALLADCEDIAETTEALATFFRYTISNVKEYVTFSDELDNAENYFTIQRCRFGDKISMELELENEQLLEARMPKLILQPLVENAVSHGLEGKLGPGTVRIAVENSDKTLFLRVRDNGVGMPEERVDQLNRQFAEDAGAPTDRQKGGIALRNVNSRIRLMFGENYGLHIFSAVGVGTECCVTLPLLFQEA